MRGFAYIHHDKDEAEPHYHIVMNVFSARTPKEIERWFEDLKDGKGEYINTFAEVLGDKDAFMKYLTHSDKKSIEEGKTYYPTECIVDYGFSQCFVKESGCDVTYEILCKLESGTPLKTLVKVYGKDFLFHYNQYKQVLEDMSFERACGARLLSESKPTVKQNWQELDEQETIKFLNGE